MNLSDAYKQTKSFLNFRKLFIGLTRGSVAVAYVYITYQLSVNENISLNAIGKLS